MPRIARAVALAAVLLLCAACGASFRPSPRPAPVSQLDIVRKQEYIGTTKATLKTFRATARDLRSRGRPVSLRELAERFDRYVALQVRPIVDDFEAQNNLATRMEIAKLQLLCGLTYAELAQPRRARDLLREMEAAWGGNPGMLGTPLDRGDVGVSSLDDGLQLLRRNLAGEAAPAVTAKPRDGVDTDPKRGDPLQRPLLR
jgi:hypothetical protein